MQAWRYSSSSSRVRSSLVKAENVRVACGDLAQVNACRDIRVMFTLRTLALLSCDGTQAQECEHYGYSRCHYRFGREFHGDLWVLQRRLEKEYLPPAAGVERSYAVSQERIMFPIGRAN